MTQLLAKIQRSLARDQALPLTERVRKAVRYVVSSLAAPWRLRGLTAVGTRARTVGTPHVANQGQMTAGADLVLSSEFSPVELIAEPGGVLHMGQGVHINYGTTIRATRQVTLGDRVSIGPYSIVDDDVPDAEHLDPSASIHIGSDVWLAGRVTVLPGTRIGDGSVITAGSIVSGTIPPGVVAGGIPARVLRAIGGDTSAPPPAVAPAIAPVAAKAPSNATAAAAVQTLRGMVLADFTVGDLSVHLGASSDGLSLVVVDAPYCQTTPSLLMGPPEDATDFVLVWTRPDLASPAFARLVSGGMATADELRADVDGFASTVRAGAARYRMTFVATWTQSPTERGLGLRDTRPGGLAWALTLMNQRLMDALADAPALYVLDAQRWLTVTGDPRFQPAKGWYMGKVPYSSALFAEAARDIKAAVRALRGGSRKLLILDLDDTMWGGIVGDAGWENVQLGGHDPIGESFVEFQRAVKALTTRGIVLGIASKNTESVALEAIDRHPEMVLRRGDFVGWRINWQDKARNIADLTAELNLGLQSVVFIDDNPVERARVREELPEVLVPEWPEDKLQYVEALRRLTCFDTAEVSKEDAERTALYAAERARSSEKTSVGSMDEWLAGLGLVIRVEALAADNAARTVQLLNKTNQLNLSTRRMTEAELFAWRDGGERSVWAVTVSDRFGSAGLTGILGLERTGDQGRIVDFVLSCRVMGRRVEDTLVHIASRWLRDHGARQLEATLLPTAKNGPTLEFLKGSALQRDEAALHFTYSLEDGVYPAPANITLQWAAGVSAEVGVS